MLRRVFDILRRVIHRVAVRAVAQHFYIISSISKGSALLRRNVPPFCQPPKPGRLMAARYDQINGTMPTGRRFHLAFEPFPEEIVIIIRFFFRDGGREFQDLIFYLFQSRTGHLRPPGIPCRHQ